MRDLINIMEGQDYGWAEIDHEVFSHMFWDINKEHWLESDYKDAGCRYFIFKMKGQPVVFASSSNDEENGSVWHHDGSGDRRINEIEITENEACAVWLHWEAVAEGDYSLALEGLVEKLKPFYDKFVADLKARFEADGQM